MPPNIVRGRPLSDIILPVFQVQDEDKVYSPENFINGVADVYGSQHTILYGANGNPIVNNQAISTQGVLKQVPVEKAIAAAGDYAAEDVISESAAAGTVWTFSGIARANGAYGYIVKAVATWQTTALTPRLVLYLFTVQPSIGAQLNDNLANNSPLFSDRNAYVGPISFPAMEDLGGMSEAIATPSTTGNLPLAFKCDPNSDDLLGILVTRDAITAEVATNRLLITLIAEQY